MKLHGNEIHSSSQFFKNRTMRFTLVVVTLFIFLTICIQKLSPPQSFTTSTYSTTITHQKSSLKHVAPPHQDEEVTKQTHANKCDIFSGDWVHNPKAPYYTNTTCWAIHEHQNCMKYGRPDTDYMKWKWQPDECDLPVFNPAQFLEMMRDKSLAFVGDSVARNQMQSLICLLSRVEYPVDVSYEKDENLKRWKYVTYNFTLATFWSPHLVKASEADSDGPTKTGLFNLYLDEYDESWVHKVEDFSYIVLSAGHWFYRPLVFYEEKKITGCRYCLLPNVTDYTIFHGYKKAFRTAFMALNGLKNYKGITFLRTFAPSHFEGGLWNEGGNCVRTKPFRSNETNLNGEILEMYMTQIEEFRRAEKEGKKRGLKFRLLDTTLASWLRPDGHPSTYGHWKEAKVTLYNDCVHWCLPGPIDTWNDFLLEMLKMEGARSYEEKLQSGGKKLKIPNYIYMLLFAASPLWIFSKEVVPRAELVLLKGKLTPICFYKGGKDELFHYPVDVIHASDTEAQIKDVMAPQAEEWFLRSC